MQMMSALGSRNSGPLLACAQRRGRISVAIDVMSCSSRGRRRREPAPALIAWLRAAEQLVELIVGGLQRIGGVAVLLGALDRRDEDAGIDLCEVLLGRQIE